MKFILPLVLGMVLFAGAGFLAGAVWGEQYAKEKVPEWQQTYACGPITMSVSFPEDGASIQVAGVPENPEKVESTSGARFENSAFGFAFRGEEVTVSNLETGEDLVTCSAISDSENAPMNFGD